MRSVQRLAARRAPRKRRPPEVAGPIVVTEARRSLRMPGKVTGIRFETLAAGCGAAWLIWPVARPLGGIEPPKGRLPRRNGQRGAGDWPGPTLRGLRREHLAKGNRRPHRMDAA